MEIMKFQGGLLRKAREARGMSMYRLAKETGVSASVLRLYELDKSVPSINVAAQLSETLRCQVEDFLAPEVR